MAPEGSQSPVLDHLHLLANTGTEEPAEECGRLCRSLLEGLHITYAHVPLANPNRKGGWEISN